MRRLLVYAPALVVLAWAIALALGCAPLVPLWLVFLVGAVAVAVFELRVSYRRTWHRGRWHRGRV